MRYSLTLLAASLILSGCLGDTNVGDANVADAKAEHDLSTINSKVQSSKLSVPAKSRDKSRQHKQTEQRTQGRRSSQGITNNIDQRRDAARNNREYLKLTPEKQKHRGTNIAYKQVGSREIRSYDGSGNNLTTPEWGSSFQHLERMTPVDYSDGVSAMAGAERKSAREISNILMGQAPGENIPNAFGASDFVWQWGQFIDHDLDLTDGSANEPLNINVPIGDHYFDPQNTGGAIIPFNRAVSDPVTGTSVDNPREQENEITAWLDGSMIYGSNQARNDALRAGNSPYLKMSKGNLLPFNENALANANGFVRDPTSLFLAGDVRANEQVGLTVLHTLFVREHNFWAKRIKDKSAKKSHDEIFEEARRIVIAEVQKITFEEFLPALVGEQSIPKYSGYQSRVNPNIMNEFSVAGYRLGHSMVSDTVWRLNKNNKAIDEGHLSLKDAFFRAPKVLNARHSIDPILRGLAKKEHQSLDIKIVDNLRNFLFGPPGAGGLDLAALNIQRGRDHGVGTYNDAREALGLTRRTHFSQVTTNTDMQNLLSAAYTHVDDIDLWVGGLAEDADLSNGAQVGELFRAMLVKQFIAVRDGDRFWYQGDYLTPQEKRQVEKSSLAKIIRRNTNIGKELQSNVFFVPAN